MARSRIKSGKLLSLHQRLQLEFIVLIMATLSLAGLLYQSASAYGMLPQVATITGITVPMSPTPIPPPPTPTPPPVATPKAAPTPAPAATAKRVTAVNSSRRTVSAKPAPVVVPSPGSSVVGLAPTGSPGTGGATGATPTPTPTSSPPPGQTAGYISSNWSGYLETGQTYTQISGSWTATNPTSVSGETTADATWIGIGGVTSNDLIQVGTQNIIYASGQVNTTAFYELLPGTAINITGLTVTPGDQMSARISQVATSQWAITITDDSTGGSWTQDVAYNSSLSSAEWIEEDPSTSRYHEIPFDFFGLAAFAQAQATANGSTVNLSQGNALPITMINSYGQTVALPSAISFDGLSFAISP